MWWSWISELASSQFFRSGLLALLSASAACAGDEGQGRRPGAADATRIVTDTLEGVLTLHAEGMTLRRCGGHVESSVVEAPGADLRGAAIGLGAATGDRLRVRVLGESVTPPTEDAGSGYESAIRAVQWVYLAEDLSDCPPGEQPELVGKPLTEGEVRRTGDPAAVERAATRFRELTSAESEADTVQGSLIQGDATSEYTAYLSSDGKVARVEERLNFGEYGSRRLVYGVSDGALFYVREEGVLRDLSPDGSGELIPRGFEVALDESGRVLGSELYGPGFPAGVEQAVRGAQEHLDRLLDLVSKRVAGRVPTG